MEKENNNGGTTIIKKTYYGDDIHDGGLKIVGTQTYGSQTDEDENQALQHTNEPITYENLQERLVVVAPRIGNSKRLWFCVCKFMMWREIVAENDFLKACSMLNETYNLNLNYRDMEAINVDCFSKSYDQWCDEKAPVHGKTYQKYITILELLYAL